jgi:hypothetical protein
MARYPQLSGLVRAMTPPDCDFSERVVPYLIECWLDDYSRSNRTADVVETRHSDFCYLFDIESARLLAAWGLSGQPRDKSRMAGHPLSAGIYHRGHAIPHTLGRPTDINLVPQLGRVNIGQFRPLEKKAVATPGSLYFTYWMYRGSFAHAGYSAQTPTGVDQGLLNSWSGTAHYTAWKLANTPTGRQQSIERFRPVDVSEREGLFEALFALVSLAPSEGRQRQ